MSILALALALALVLLVLVLVVGVGVLCGQVPADPEKGGSKRGSKTAKKSVT